MACVLDCFYCCFYWQFIGFILPLDCMYFRAMNFKKFVYYEAKTQK
jgi:hypothetical protein